MKKFLAVIALAMVLVWGVGIQKASAGYMDPVSFFAVDDNDDPKPNGDDFVTLSITDIISDGSILEYSLDNSSWSNAGTSFTVAAGDWTKVYLRLNYATSLDTGGIITFTGPEGDLYNGFIVEWNPNYRFTIAVANDDDNVAPVPIPAAVWLLGSGLFGLVGIRRRMKK